MKHLRTYGLLLLFTGLLLAGGTALSRFLQSPAALGWIFKTVSKHSSITLTARSIKGGLGSPLQLEGLSVRWPEGELKAAELRLRYQPLLLTFGNLAIQELALKGVKIQDNSPPTGKGPEFVWPRVTGLPTLIDAWVDHLSIQGLSCRQLNGPETLLPDISAVLFWRNAHLTLSEISLATGEGRISGMATAGLDTPSLFSSLVFKKFDTTGGPDRIELRTALKPGQTGEQLAGKISAALYAGNSPHYALAGTAGMGKGELHLKDILITEKGRKGCLKASGTVSFSGSGELQLNADNLDLSTETGSPLTLNGTMNLTGAIDRYSGRFRFSADGDSWRKSSLSGGFSGTMTDMTISSLKARLLGGAINGTGTIDWKNGTKVAASLRGDGLDPASLDPSWNGVINFDLESSAVWTGGKLRQARGDGRLRTSRLLGRELAGSIAVGVDRDIIRVDRLLLTGKGFDLNAAGSLREQLKITAAISDLSALIPGAQGSLAFRGWGRYADGMISGDISGQGTDLEMNGTHVKKAGLRAALGGDRSRGVRMEAELTGLKSHGLQIDSSALTLEGDLESHFGTMTIRSRSAEISGTVSGRFAEKRWLGRINGLHGLDQAGPWQLTAPATVSASADGIRLSPLQLSGLTGENAGLSGELRFRPLGISADADWKNLKLDRLNQWLDGYSLTGDSSGRIHARTIDNERLVLQGEAGAQGSVTAGNQKLEFRNAEVRIDAGEQGTAAKLELAGGKGLTLSGEFSSSEPALMKLPARGHIKALWSGIDPALAQQWLPDGMNLHGRLSGNIYGDLLPEERLDLKGTLLLADGKGDWKRDDRLHHAEVPAAKLDWQWRDETFQGDLSLALAKSGAARATFQIPMAARLKTSVNRNAPLKGQLSGRFEDNGALAALFPDSIRESRGAIEVDLNAGGTLQAPMLDGRIDLTGAGASITEAGIKLADIGLTAQVNGELIPPRRSDSTDSKPVLALLLEAKATGSAAMGDTPLTIQAATMNLKSGSTGTEALIQLKAGDAFFADAAYRSTEQLTLSPPSSGDLTASWSGLDTGLARKWLPSEFDLKGSLNGRVAGKLLPDRSFDLHGEVGLADARGVWQDAHQKVSAALKTSRFLWTWRNESLRGDFSFSLANFGEAKGDFQLPLPARFDTAPLRNGPVKGSLSGRFRGKGILTSLFPGLFQETKGLLKVDLTAVGSWQTPSITGSVGLTEASAYLPRAGIRLKDIQVAARMAGSELFIDSFSAGSGDGTISGTAAISFTGKTLSGYRGTLKGTRFQTVYLPEMKLELDPDISFNGDLEKVTARGEVKVASMHVDSLKPSTVVKPSRDVVIKGAGPAAAAKGGPEMDIRLHLLLGDSTFVKTAGLDARLEGDLLLNMTGPESIKGTGEINVVKGSYRFRSVNLDIKRGKAIFADDPIERPALDILALREIEHVKAGVSVTGTPELPIVKLYSEPAMQETEILAYLLLGRKRSTSGEQSGLLMEAVSLITASNDTKSFEDQFKELISLDTITLAPDQDKSTGYRPIEPSISGNPAKNDDSSTSPSLLQLGKYLTPQLYISYGRSLFDNNQQLRARYTLGKKLEIESKVTNTATGGDLYYLIELE